MGKQKMLPRIVFALSVESYFAKVFSRYESNIEELMHNYNI